MRLRKRHAWGAVLIFLFILPIVRPQGISLIEDPTANTVHWFAEVPFLNPRLLMDRSEAQAAEGKASPALERERLHLYNQLFKLGSRLKQAGALGKALRAGGLDRLPRAVLCRVLRAHDASSSRRSILIDRGRADGLTAGLPAVVGGVYLGRVAVVHNHTALIRLVTDRESKIEVFVRTTKGVGLRGYARRTGTSNGQDILSIEFLRTKTGAGEIRPGAPVFTANFHELVPAHLLVGRIESVSDPDMDAMPTLTMTPLFNRDTATEVVVLRTDEVYRRESPATSLSGGAPSENARGRRALDVGSLDQGTAGG